MEEIKQVALQMSLQQYNGTAASTDLIVQTAQQFEGYLRSAPVPYKEPKKAKRK